VVKIIEEKAEVSQEKGLNDEAESYEGQIRQPGHSFCASHTTVRAFTLIYTTSVDIDLYHTQFSLFR
jgi:hypothetical protein